MTPGTEVDAPAQTGELGGSGRQPGHSGPLTTLGGGQRSAIPSGMAGTPHSFLWMIMILTSGRGGYGWRPRVTVVLAAWPSRM